MKKIFLIIFILLICGSTIYLGFGYKHNLEPNRYYQVYLDDELLGTIKSKDELEKYIDKRGEYIKNKYHVDKILKPIGLEVKKVSTYSDKLDTIESLYDKILDKKAFTLAGYQFTLTGEFGTKKIYVLDEDIVEKAITETIETFVGKEKYDAFKNNKQKQIETTGSYTNNIYLNESITIKEINIPVNERIFTTADELATYLLFGDDPKKEVYVVQAGDTISKVAFNHQIGISEFLMSNPEFTSENNLLFPGEEVIIAETNPQISVVIEEKIVEDVVDKFQINEVVDTERLVGDDRIVQEGEDGLSRITRDTKRINGTVIYSDTQKREILKPSVDEIISKGGKVIPNVGSLTSWGWPTGPGWILTDDYVWRINPVTGKRELHSGIDISGLGYYAPIYATNNGTIMTKTYRSDYGNYIVINHNNGYYTVYAHMAAFANPKVGDTVGRGELIGYMGMTGWATGVHLHYEVWKGCTYCRISPWSIY